MRIVTALLFSCTPPARFHAAAFLRFLAGMAVGQGRSGVRQTLNRALGSRYSISAPLRRGAIWTTEVRREAHAVVETYLHGWTLLSWSYPTVVLAGGMILLHACVTSSSPSPSLHLRVLKSLTLPETVRMETHMQERSSCAAT